MSYDLTVEYIGLPDDLKSRWEEAFSSVGFELEICPGFEPETWKGGFVPMKVRRAPRELVGINLPNDAVSGFELWIEDTEADFRSGAGRPTTEFAIQCIGAALLARLTSGSYVDPQEGARYSAAEALDAAVREVKAFVADARDRELVHHPFPGWAALGVDVND